MKKFLISTIAILLSYYTYSQEQGDSVLANLFSMSLEELMNIEVQVASKAGSNLRESPGIVSVLTENEIRHSGARDLIDLLRLLPGLEFGAEWDGIIGLGVRGNNATEGKALVLINGHQINETNYGIFPFGRHILPDQIKRIEVIRGPGSSQYGGAAELAVVNIILKKGDDLKGFDISSGIGYSHGALSNKHIQANFGKTFKKLIFNLGGYYNQSNRSNLNLLMLDSTEIGYEKLSRIQSANFNFGIKSNNLNVSALFDRFVTQNTEDAGDVLFQGFFGSVDYTLNINDKLRIVPEISVMRQLPWYFLENEPKEIYNTKNTRLTGMITSFYKFNSKIQLITGIEYFMDASKKDVDGEVFSNNKNSISYNNFSVFAEGVLTPKFANITVGARFDNHSEYGNAFVPRIAFTKAIDDFHFKLLASRAFKAPTISNIDLNSYIVEIQPDKEIKPELTTVFELEMGYKIANKIFLVANVFDIKIKDPIFWAPPPVDTYINLPKTGSRGAEISCRLQDRWGAITMSYSYYRAMHNEVEYYEIEDKEHSYGAFPQNRLTLFSNIRTRDRFYINPTIHIFGKRYTYIHDKTDWSSAKIVTYDAQILANLFLTYNFRNLEASIGIYDIFDLQYKYSNSYQGWQNPIPDTGREFSLKLRYKIWNTPD